VKTSETLKPCDYYIYIACFNIIKLRILPTHCVRVLRMVRTINIDFVLKQH
jgi:hypothetical protein